MPLFVRHKYLRDVYSAAEKQDDDDDDDTATLETLWW